MPKYFLAYTFDKKLKREIESKAALFSDVEPIKNYHVSFLFPFRLKEEYKLIKPIEPPKKPKILKTALNSIASISPETVLISRLEQFEFTPFQARLGALSIFYQEKKVLYLSVHPETHFNQIHESLESLLQDIIEFDQNAFKNGLLPAYKAHVSLDYNFTGDEQILKKNRNLFRNLKFWVNTLDLYQKM